MSVPLVDRREISTGSVSSNIGFGHLLALLSIVGGLDKREGRDNLPAFPLNVPLPDIRNLASALELA